MRWFRTRRQFCGWVALLALALQLALSFGHVHGLDTDSRTALASIAANSGAPQQPAGGQHSDDDYCAICAVITMLSGAQCAAPPALATPSACVTQLPPLPLAVPRLIARHDSFRSRAPPLS
jgi:hypothetical protein